MSVRGCLRGQICYNAALRDGSTRLNFFNNAQVRVPSSPHIDYTRMISACFVIV